MATSASDSDMNWKDAGNLARELSSTSITPSSSALHSPPPLLPTALPAYEGPTFFGHAEGGGASEGRMVAEALTSFIVSDLRRYLAPFDAYFKRSEGRQSLERHLTGLLAAIDRKNGEQIAHAVAGTNSQRLQALLTELHWDADALNQQRVRQLIREATLRGGTLLCGEVEMQKQGSFSVGVSRQYVERLGRTKNCQLLLSWQYVDSAFSWPVNTQLYLPQEWTQNPEKCRRARIPAEKSRFHAKAEILLALLDEATQWGVPYRSVASAMAFGSDPAFLEGLEKRGVEYLVAVPEDFAIQVARRKSLAGEFAQDAIARLAESAWQTISGGRNAEYGSRDLWARVMGWRVTPAGPAAFGWLLAERPLDGGRGPVRYYFTNASPQVSLNALIRLARRTSRLDEFYHFTKSELGWSHYEGRLWHGLHRHALLVFLAYSFLLALRTQQNRKDYREGSEEENV